jgi:hypothetical protein
LSNRQNKLATQVPVPLKESGRFDFDLIGGFDWTNGRRNLSGEIEEPLTGFRPQRPTAKDCSSEVK